MAQGASRRARADACGNRRSRRLEPGLDDREVFWARHLQQAAIALDDLHAPASRFDEGRTVARVRDIVSERFPQNRREERLRGLHRCELAARKRLDDTIAFDALDGIAQ